MEWSNNFSHYNLILTLCMLHIFSCFNCRLLTFFQNQPFKRFFQDHYQSFKELGFCWAWSESKLFCMGFQQTTKVVTSKEIVKWKNIKYVISPVNDVMNLIMQKIVLSIEVFVLFYKQFICTVWCIKRPHV